MDHETDAAAIHRDLGRLLHLRRAVDPSAAKDSPAAFRSALALRPDWIPSAARMSIGDEADACLASFADPAAAASPRAQSDAARVTAALSAAGYTAAGLQSRFRVDGPPTIAPFYVTAALTRRTPHADMSRAPARPEPPIADPLDALTRAFLLGRAVPVADLAAAAGRPALRSLRRLGLLRRCPADRSRAIAMVQLYPVDAAAAAAADAAAAAAGPCELVFATDWPPPVTAGLTEEPVMYIGPDSLGLVRLAPRRPAGKVRPL
jgi:hypothetical protein